MENKDERTTLFLDEKRDLEVKDENVLEQEWKFWYMMRGKTNSTTVVNVAENPQLSLESAAQATAGPGSGNAGSFSTYEHNIHPIASFQTIDQFWAIYGHIRRPHSLPSNSDYHLFRVGIKPVWEDPANIRGGKWMVRLRKGLITRLWEHLILALVGNQFCANEHCEEANMQDNISGNYSIDTEIDGKLVKKASVVAATTTATATTTIITPVVAGKKAQEKQDNASSRLEVVNVVDGICGIVLSIRHQEDILSVWTSDAHDEMAKTRIRETLRKVLCLPPVMILEYKAHDQSLRDKSSFRNTDKFKI